MPHPLQCGFNVTSPQLILNRSGEFCGAFLSNSAQFDLVVVQFAVQIHVRYRRLADHPAHPRKVRNAGTGLDVGVRNRWIRILLSLAPESRAARAALAAASSALVGSL